MNRTAMYRAIRKGVSSDAIERGESYWQQRAQDLNAGFRRLGWSKADVDSWWNLRAQPQLGHRTPLQAWNIGERETVVALAHALGA